MNKYKIYIFFALLLSLNDSVFSQISLESEKILNAVCPRIEPMRFDEMDDKYEKTASRVLKHYFYPVLKVFSGPVNVVSGVVENAGIYATYIFNSTSASGQALVDIYDSHIVVAKNDVILTNLVMSIQQVYQGQPTFDGLNTKVALSILGKSDRAEAVSALGKTIACVAPNTENRSHFEVAFYGLRKTDCERLQRSFNVARLATNIYVNNSAGGVCQNDFMGESLKQLRVFSFYGRNQVTYVFPKM